MGLLSGLIALPVIAASGKTKAVMKDQTSLVQPVVAGDPAAGKLKSEDQRCQECHADDDRDHSNAPEFKSARLGGQYAEYIVKQMRDFRSGARKHEFMAMMANTIDDADVIDIAAYFASEKKMHGNGSEGNELAKNLYVNGDASRNILPCISCHGENGKGISAKDVLYPVIGGQDLHYLEKQIFDWRSGERRNSSGGIMNITSKSLTDAEILALAHYISGL